jgi:hypothetical protein
MVILENKIEKKETFLAKEKKETEKKIQYTLLGHIGSGP